MNPNTIKKIIKYEIIFIFALYAFAGGKAFAINITGGNYTYQTEAQSACSNLENRDTNCSISYSPLSYRAGVSTSNVTYYFYFTTIGAPPAPTAPDLASCTETRLSYTQPAPGFFSDKLVQNGCVYETSGVTACFDGICFTDVQATSTYIPDELICPTDQICTAEDSQQIPIPSSNPEQQQTADLISTWWGLEPTETFMFSDGTQSLKYESLSGCVLEVIVQVDGSYAEQSDSCNVHNTDSTFPSTSDESTHTNPDGSPNTSGTGSGNTGSPSAGSSGGGTSGGTTDGTSGTDSSGNTDGTADISGGNTDPTTTETPEDPAATSCLDGEKCEVLLTGEGDPTADPETVIGNLIGGYGDALEAEINEVGQFDPSGQIEVIQTPNLMTRQSCNAALYAADFNGFIVSILSKFCVVYESHGRPLLAWAFGFITFIYIYRTYYATINPTAA